VELVDIILRVACSRPVGRVRRRVLRRRVLEETVWVAAVLVVVLLLVVDVVVVFACHQMVVVVSGGVADPALVTLSVANNGLSLLWGGVG
jgi:hypothetical protein